MGKLSHELNTSTSTRMFYPDTGWTDFDLYEFDLREA